MNSVGMDINFLLFINNRGDTLEKFDLRLSNVLNVTSVVLFIENI